MERGARDRSVSRNRKAQFLRWGQVVEKRRARWGDCWGGGIRGDGGEGAGVAGEEVYAGLWHFAFFKLSADRRYLPWTQNKPMLLAFSFERTKNRSGLAGGNATCQVYTEAGLNPSPTLLPISPLFFPRRFAMETARRGSVITARTPNSPFRLRALRTEAV